MLEDFVYLHKEATSRVPKAFRRSLYQKINWKAQGLCIIGDRGVGKTTLICQDLLTRYKTADRALYISADHVTVLSYGLVNLAKDYFGEGGEALYIDEVHKYPNWSVEIKNLLDTYKGRQIIFSASSSLDLNQSKGDLSRRVVYHRLSGLSFREFLLLAKQVDLPVLSLSDILQNHVAIASKCSTVPILKYFKEYLEHGYYPFFTGGLEDYFSKLNNVIEKVLFEDIAVIYNLRQSTLPLLKKILWLVATSNGLIPNIDKMSKNLGVSRELVYQSIEYLVSAGLLLDILPEGNGNTLIRKPAKVYMHSTNLLHAIHGSLKLEVNHGGMRETFFANQVSCMHKVSVHDRGDFLVDDRWVMEIGGKNKNDYQIQSEENAYLILDDIEIGFGRKIPLYLFGFLY